MNITVTKITDLDIMRKACESTMRGQKSRVNLDEMYRCEHSPIRTQLFWITMEGIPTFVSVHLVRHEIGVEHFVMSNREDRGGTGKEDRYTPVNHSMFINAQALIYMSRKRLCGQASDKTVEVWQEVKDAVDLVDPILSKYMVRECEYRNGKCPELRCCGNLWTNAEELPFVR